MNIQEIIKIYKDQKEEIKISERSELVKRFIDKLNTNRVDNGFKKLPASFYAIKMADAGLKEVSDLYWFYRYCEDGRDFSKTWWWSLKVK